MCYIGEGAVDELWNSLPSLLAVEVACEFVLDELHEVGVPATHEGVTPYNTDNHTDGMVIIRATRSIIRMMAMVVRVDVAWQLKGCRTVLYL